MTRRRLNKKVALIGSAVFATIALLIILVIFQLGRDPAEIIQEAQAALNDARQATEPQAKQRYYDKAERNLRAAYMKAKDNILREEVLFMMLDMYLETQEWPYIVACWDEMININPDNAKARYGKLRYFQILAESGTGGAWQKVHEEATEFIKIAGNAGLLKEEITKWDVPGIEQKPARQQYLGPYLYLLRGISSLEMASAGAVTNKDEMLTQAIEDIRKAQQLDQDNIDAYWHLARAIVARGEMLSSLGNFEEKDKSVEEAKNILEQAVKIAGNNPRAYINLMQLKLMLAKNSTPELRRENLRSLESDYISLAKRFNGSAEIFAALSEYYLIYSKYSGPGLCQKNLDSAIETIEKAISLDELNVGYAIDAADLFYRRYSMFGRQEDILKALEIAKNALDLPQVQDTSGPQHQTRIIYRFQLYAFMANCYLEQILASKSQKTESDVQVLLSSMEQAVHEIEQILGSKEEPLVVKWQGMLELARGNQKAAVEKLYSAYEQLKALKPSTPPWPKDMEFAYLSYTLANIFKDTPEIGAVKDFLISALYSGIADVKPEARLDYVEAAMDLNPWMEVIQHIDAFEEYHGSGRKSQNLRIKTYIRAMQFDEAEKELAKRYDNDAETIKLRLALIQAKIRHTQAEITQKQKRDSSILQETGQPDTQPDDSDRYMTQELIRYKQIESDLAEKILATEPNAVEQSLLISVCKNYIAQDKAGPAEDFIARYLKHFPENITALVYWQVLREPVPKEVTLQRYKDIEEKTLLNLTDPLYKALHLGIFYRQCDMPEKAIEQLRTAISRGASMNHAPGDRIFNQVKLAVEHLFEIALLTNNWELAEEAIKTARNEDLDDCRGMVFESRLAAAKGELEKALAKIDECLKQKPVFSQGYLIRSNINAALGSESASMDDIAKAASLNPLDGSVAKKAATALYIRNRNLGDNVLPNQVAEARSALERAIRLNINDLELHGLYAEFIASAEPLKAIAIRQDILETAPSVENAILLGKLAMKVALEQANTDSKEALLNIAGSAFEQAKIMDPKDKRMLYYYADYFRTRGMENEAMKLLAESQDNQLLWNHYFQLGRYEDAGKVLTKAYKENPKDAGVLRGLIQVAEKTVDQESVKKYSNELIRLEDTAANNLSQVQAYLRTGLIDEAESKLQRIKKKYPDEPGLLLLEAWLLLKQGLPEAALELADKSLLSEKNNAAAWCLKGEINIELAEYDKAISDLRTSKLLSDDPITRVYLSRAYLNAKRYEDAITELKNTIAVPNAPQEARLLLEHIYTQLDRKEALIRFYRDMMDEFPDNAEWFNRAGAFALKTGRYDDAELLYQKSCQIIRKANPGQSPKELVENLTYATALDGFLKALLMGAGESGTERWIPGKADKALEECRQYLDTSFAPIAYLRMAEANYKYGNKSDTSKYCRTALDKTGTNEALASEVLMRMFLMLGADEVSDYCMQRLESNPDSIAANFTMFNLINIKKDYINALNYISKCVDLADPGDPGRANYIIRKVETLIQLYEQTSDNKYIDMAVADYESLLAEMPKNINVLNNFAYLLAEHNKRCSEALRYAKQALDAKPNDPGIMDTYAYVLHKNGENLEAARYVETALELYSERSINHVPPEVYEHKGMIKEKLGANGEALAAYKMALEIGSDVLTEKVRERITRAIERVSP
ncbi:MAG: tetratricopeptide repeat protein [Sedimentisphaerales bacterium]|nr:tetratricopeptide repeat protein [Sedimentisphaerales bacterium]